MTSFRSAHSRLYLTGGYPNLPEDALKPSWEALRDFHRGGGGGMQRLAERKLFSREWGRAKVPRMVPTSCSFGGGCV